jgi:hypothetical protein
MAFKSQINVSLGWNWNEGAVDNGRADYAKQLLDAGGDFAADAAWSAKEQMLVSGGSIALDLTALQKTILGGAYSVGLAAVKAVMVVNHAGGTLTLGGAPANEWSAPFGSPGDQIALPPDNSCLLSNARTGWPVSAAQRNLKLAATGGDVIYSIVLIGTLI